MYTCCGCQTPNPWASISCEACSHDLCLYCTFDDLSTFLNGDFDEHIQARLCQTDYMSLQMRLRENGEWHWTALYQPPGGLTVGYEWRIANGTAEEEENWARIRQDDDEKRRTTRADDWGLLLARHAPKEESPAMDDSTVNTDDTHKACGKKDVEKISVVKPRRGSHRKIPTTPTLLERRRSKQNVERPAGMKFKKTSSVKIQRLRRNSSTPSTPRRANTISGRQGTRSVVEEIIPVANAYSDAEAANRWVEEQDSV